MKDIIFLMADQLSAKWLELGMDGVCELPNFKRLRERGMYFDHAYSNNPVCCPARATIATGLSSRSHGVIENGYFLDPDIPTFMKVLQEKGYRTGAFGKVHFMPHYSGFDHDCRAYGFDVAHITEDNRGGEWYDWAVSEYPEYREQILRSFSAPKVEALKSYGKNRENLQAEILKLREQDWSDPDQPYADQEAHYMLFPEEISQTAWIADKALEFIRDTPEDRPLFAHISFVQPHNPYEVPKGYMEKVDADKIPERIKPTWMNDPDRPEYFKDKTPADKEGWKFDRQVYLASIAFIDKYIGKILDELEKVRGIEDTYFIFVSDHGDLLGDHGFYLKEEKHYDACIRIPLIISGPGIATASESHRIVQLEDICPTVLDMADGRLPLPPFAEVYMKIDPQKIPLYHGCSLMPLLKGEKISGWRTAGYCESYNPVFSMAPTDWARTVITDRYRYTYYFRGGEQLFDLCEDPDEQKNVAQDEKYRAVKQKLKDELLEKIIGQDYPKSRTHLYCFGVH